jgi:hypothetical protein
MEPAKLANAVSRSEKFPEKLLKSIKRRMLNFKQN